MAGSDGGFEHDCAAGAHDLERCFETTGRSRAVDDDVGIAGRAEGIKSDRGDAEILNDAQLEGMLPANPHLAAMMFEHLCREIAQPAIPEHSDALIPRQCQLLRNPAGCRQRLHKDGFRV